MILFFLSTPAGCNNDNADTGKQGGPCYTNGTCDQGLDCVNNICVQVTTEPGDDSADPNDGSLGSSCGTCNAGLTCVTDAPSGYCTKSCTDSAQCGAGAYCYNTDDFGPLCLRACSNDADCRAGYTCQGEAGSTVCYPSPDGTPGEGTPGTGNASLQGCYAMNDGVSFQLWFDGSERFQDIAFNPLSGQVVYGGSYTVANGKLTLHYDDGTIKEYSLVIYSGYITLNGTPYTYAGAQCT
jgi:hypothetical protein